MKDHSPESMQLVLGLTSSYIKNKDNKFCANEFLEANKETFSKIKKKEETQLTKQGENIIKLKNEENFFFDSEVEISKPNSSIPDKKEINFSTIYEVAIALYKKNVSVDSIKKITEKKTVGKDLK
jgi:hypothetical protein